MSKFQFQLDSLMKYRDYQRDQCRQILAGILQQQTAIQNQIDASQNEREETCEEIRSGSLLGEIDVQYNASRRFYLSQIDQKTRELQLQLEQIQQQVDLGRKALQQADAAVKSLEQLKEKRFKVHEHQQLKQQDIELQDAWNAVQQLQT